MTYTDIMNRLADYADQAQQANDSMERSLATANERYAGEYLKDVMKQIADETEGKLAKIHESATSYLETAMDSIQVSLDKKFFNNISVENAAELELISKTPVDLLEMEGYIRKFKGNGAALRRLEQIALANNIEVHGASYAREMGYKKSFGDLFKGFITAMKSGDHTRMKIGLNMITPKLADHEALQAKEITVTVKRGGL